MKPKMNKLLQRRIDAAMKHDSYWIEAAKLDFSLELESERKRLGKNYAEVAAALGTSAAYISKIFRGDANLTIESMVKLARILECNLELKLKEGLHSPLQKTAWSTASSKISLEAYKQFSESFSREEHVQVGKFNLPARASLTNDHKYQDAA